METNYISLHQYVLSKWQVYWTASREQMLAAQQQSQSPIEQSEDTDDGSIVVESEATRREKRVCVEQEGPEDSPRSIAGGSEDTVTRGSVAAASPRDLAVDLASEPARTIPRTVEPSRALEASPAVENVRSSTTRVALLNEKLFNSYMHVGEPIILLTPTTSHSLVSWTNKAFRNKFGWSFGDVIGYEIFFMHGDAANVIPLAKRFKDVEVGLKEIADIHQRFYTYDGTLVDCKVTVFPIMEPSSGDPSKPMVAFLGVRFVSVTYCVFPPDLLNPVPKIFEVGLPMDRREYCKTFRDYYGKPSERNCIFNDAHFQQFCHKASFTNVVSLMMATPDCMLVCNRHGEVVIGSSSWCQQFGFQGKDLIGVNINVIASQLSIGFGTQSKIGSLVLGMYRDCPALEAGQAQGKDRFAKVTEELKVKTRKGKSKFIISFCLVHKSHNNDPNEMLTCVLFVNSE